MMNSSSMAVMMMLALTLLFMSMLVVEGSRSINGGVVLAKLANSGPSSKGPGH